MNKPFIVQHLPWVKGKKELERVLRDTLKPMNGRYTTEAGSTVWIVSNSKIVGKVQP